MGKTIVVLTNLILIILLYKIAANKSVLPIMYAVSRTPYIVRDLVRVFYLTTEEHCKKNGPLYIARALKRLIFYYEVKYIQKHFASISKRGEYEVENLEKDSPVIDGLMSYFDGRQLIKFYNNFQQNQSNGTKKETD